MISKLRRIARSQVRGCQGIMVPVIILLLLQILLYWDLLFEIDHKIFGGPFDPSLVLMQLKWGADYLLGRIPQYISSLFSFPIYYPYGNSFAISDNMLGNQPIWFPLYVLTGNPVLATNIWILLCNALNFGVFSYYISQASFFRSIVVQKRSWIAILCGALFAFSGFRLDRHVHLQLLPHFWTPLALLFLDQAAIAPAWPFFVALSVALSFQWAAGTHLGVMASLIVAFFSFFYILTTTQRRSFLLGLTFSAVLCALLLLPIALSSLTAMNTGLRFDEQLALSYAPGIAGLAKATYMDHAALRIGVSVSEGPIRALFPGVLMSLLLTASLLLFLIRPPRRVISWMFMGLSLLLLFVATGEGKIVSSLPLFSIIRDPGRMSLAALIPCLLLIADSLGRMLGPVRSRILVVMGLLILSGEVFLRDLPAGRYPLAKDESFEAVLRKSLYRPVMLLPQSVGTPNNHQRLRKSQNQMELLSKSWVPGFAGRSGPRPPFINFVTAQSLNLLKFSQIAPRFAARARRLGFAAIVVMPGVGSAGYCRALSEALGKPEVIGGIYRYFPLYRNPEDTPLPAELDIGSQMKLVISRGAYTSNVERKGDKGIRVMILPNEPLLGVVQRKEVVRIPYSLLTPEGNRVEREAEIVLDQVTDKPNLGFSLPLPREPGWNLEIGGRVYSLTAQISQDLRNNQISLLAGSTSPTEGPLCRLRSAVSPLF